MARPFGAVPFFYVRKLVRNVRNCEKNDYKRTYGASICFADDYKKKSASQTGFISHTKMY